MTNPWEGKFSKRTAWMKSSFIRELLKVTNQPDVISFGGGFPAGELFPVERVKEACEKILTENPQKALQYSTTEGYDPLRQYLVDDYRSRGVNIGLQNIQITGGSQQALDFIGRIFVNEGDKLLVESPTYLGALQAWNAYGPEYVTVETDDDGMQVDKIEAIIKEHDPRFIYVLPNFHNPMGVSMSIERRKQLVEISHKYNLPIVEDDPYGKLIFEGEMLPSIAKLDCQFRKGVDNFEGNVIHTSTFSKILAPGLRIGWAIGPEEVIKKMVQAKQGADLQCSTFDQYIAYELVAGDWLPDHIELIKRVYKERRDAMLQAFEDFMPEGTTWTTPAGGLFLWLRLPEGCDSLELFPKAVEQRVAYVPGVPFYPIDGPRNTMRLNFSASDPEKIREGVRRISVMAKNALAGK
ncbi:MAG TPA: PLP-dependent aminotransferase family protein [Anaerolineaceae bacterium]|jgi:2-aminoadipate transaminase|nr:PLP-dependent aminotransferase family protein [Anaerolineaceae bacterium]